MNVNINAKCFSDDQVCLERAWSSSKKALTMRWCKDNSGNQAWTSDREANYEAGKEWEDEEEETESGDEEKKKRVQWTKKQLQELREKSTRALDRTISEIEDRREQETHQLQ